MSKFTSLELGLFKADFNLKINKRSSIGNVSNAGATTENLTSGLRISQEAGINTTRFSAKDNDMETQVNLSRHSSRQPPYVVKRPASDGTSNNMFSIKIGAESNKDTSQPKFSEPRAQEKDERETTR